jgi:RNA polymerase sigma-70 factor (ECF subfamily)
MDWTNAPLDGVIRSAQQGDLSAFEEIVRRYETRIRAWAVSHTPPGGDADEVAQVTFVKACHGLAGFRAGTNFEGWLFTIARYQLMTESTRLRRLADYRSRYVPDILERELARRAESPEDEPSERLTLLRACLAEMDERGRKALRWRYDEGIPMQVMAERAGRTVAACKKWLFTLRQKLQACVERKLVSERGG